MIEAVQLCKSYHHTQVLRSVSFRIEDGEIVGLLGPNGAGKTTTMRILTTFLPPTSGTAKVAGYDICCEGEKVRENIGYLPEHPPLYGEMTVEGYLRFAARLKKTPDLNERVEEIIVQCGLKDSRRKRCAQLSKGYRQRVGIAQALVNGPKVIIFDEPTTGLDPSQIVEVRSLISSLAGRHTVILSTHILQEVAQTCSRVLMIVNGRIAAQERLDVFSREKSLEQRFLEVVEAAEAPGNPEIAA